MRFFKPPIGLLWVIWLLILLLELAMCRDNAQPWTWSWRRRSCAAM
jgi:hypothetical protein